MARPWLNVQNVHAYSNMILAAVLIGQTVSLIEFMSR
jgi:hypothetical protein